MTDAVVSQVAVEVLRPNSALGVTATVGSFSLVGKTASLPNISKRFSLTGNPATLTYVPDLNPYAGAFVLTGVAASLKAKKATIGQAGSFNVAGQSATNVLTRRGAIVLLVGI